MNLDNLLDQNRNLTKQKNICLRLLIIMIVANLLLVVTIAFSSQIVKTIPSEISGTYEFKGNKVNDIYLKDNALEVARVILNITPSNIEQMQKAVLRATHPSAHFSLKTAISTMAKEITSRNISTAFYPLSIEVKTNDLTADIYGEYYAFFGGISKKELRTYRLKFTSSNIGLLLLEFFEIKEGDE